MTNMTISPRAEARELIDQALGLGVRGPLRAALLEAARVAAGDRGELEDLHYRQSKPGARITDRKRRGLLFRRGRDGIGRFKYRTSDPADGRQVEIDIGVYQDPGSTTGITLAEARDRWRALKTARRSGGLPAQDADGQADTPLLLGDVLKRYLAEYGRAVKRPRTVAEDQRLLEKHVVPSLGSVAVTEVTRAHFADLLFDLHRSAPREAEKVRTLLSSVFEVAAGRTRKIAVPTPWVPDTVGNPVRTVMLPRRAAKSYAPGRGELRAYAAGIAAGIPGGYTQVLRLQMLTGARIGELTRSRWQDYDPVAGTLTLPVTKNGQPHAIMLSSQARELVDALDRRGDWLFPAPTDSGRGMDEKLPMKSLARCRSRLGVTAGFTTHAVRRAMVTTLAELQVGRAVRDRVTNHRTDAAGIESHYNFAELNEPARAAWQVWADHLDALAAEDPAQVVPLQRRA